MARLIAIEGIDGSGKGTHARLLREALSADGDEVALLSFPRYAETRFGHAIGEFLNGRFGSLGEVHPQLASLLFAGDRYESKAVIDEALSCNDVVICDRYVASNIAHQSAKLDEPDRSELMAWIAAIEFDVYQLPRADLTLLLDLPAATAQQLIARKSARGYTDKAADLQEADGAYLERVRQVYCLLAAEAENWQQIGVERDGQLRSIDDVASEIVTTVRLSASD